MKNKKYRLYFIAPTFIIALVVGLVLLSHNASPSSRVYAYEHLPQHENTIQTDVVKTSTQSIDPFATGHDYYLLRIFYYSSLQQIELGNPHKKHSDKVLAAQYNSNRTFQGLLSPLLESGYYFVGWYTEKNGGVKLVKESDLVYTSESFTEQYDDDWYLYADHFHRLYAHYEPVVLPADPIKEHYIFEGWYTDAALSTKYEGQGLTADTTLHAKFTPKTYKITFVTGFSDCILADKPVTALTGGGTIDDIEKTGYIFKGWFSDPQKTIPYNPETPLTRNIEVFADWEVVMIKVTFLVDGEVYTTLNIPYGSSLIELQEELELFGLNILSVAFDNGAAGEFDNNSLLLTDSATIVAEKKRIDQTITDTIRSNYLGIILGVALALMITLIPSSKHKRRIRG